MSKAEKGRRDVGRLRVDAHVPGQVDQREQQITELFAELPRFA